MHGAGPTEVPRIHSPRPEEQRRATEPERQGGGYLRSWDPATIYLASSWPCSTAHWLRCRVPVRPHMWAALGHLPVAGSGQGAWYVELLGQDQVHRHCHGFGFSGSIDLAKALSAEVVLTTELNGAPVPQVHGFPPRAVVLGWIGARSVNGWADHAIGGALLKVFSEQRIGSSGRSARTRRATSHKGAALSEAPIVTVDPAPDLVVRRAECPYAGRPWALGSAGHCGQTSIAGGQTGNGLRSWPAQQLPGPGPPAKQC